MSRSPLLAVLCLAAGAVYADRTVDTPRLSSTWRLGSPVRLENRLTGEVLDLAPPDASPAVNLPRKRLSIAQAEQSDDSQFAVGDRVLCRTEIVAGADGDLVLSQQARMGKPGLVDVGWGLAGVPSDRVQVVIPGASGVAFGGDRGVPFRETTYNWPSGWEAGFVLLQMEKGGFLIWAKDADWRFKRCRLSHQKGFFSLRFESEAEPPFENVAELASVPWHVTAYAGDWRAGASIYRDWLRGWLKPPLLAERSPAWIGDITGMVITGMDAERIQELAKHVNPARTMLYVPGWRRDGYDLNYPDYTPVPEFAPFVAEAHRLGFRVMAHVNYFGCDPKHPLYETFAPHHLRSPGSDALEWWTWPRDLPKGEEPPIKFAYIHPGSTAWRQELVRRFTQLVEETGVDSLHLDQTLHMVNHNRGRVDGMTVPEGNLALHRDLRAALPQVALSGEGLDEVTFCHEAFAQRHAARAVNHSKATWDDRFVPCTHPVASFLFAPHTTINGYLGMCNPNNAGLWDAWTRAYEPWGVIPTFSHPGLAQLRDPGPRDKLARDLLQLWTQHRLLPDYEHPDTTANRLVWRGDNATAVMERNPTGGSELRVKTGQEERRLYQYATGVGAVTTTGAIPNWLAYREQTLLGLSPDHVYLILPDTAPAEGPHFTALPERLVLRASRSNELFLAGDFADAEAGLVLNLAESSDQAEAFLLGPEGPKPIGDGASFDETTVVDETGMQRAIFAHPPWKNQGPGAPDTTCGRFRLRLPDHAPATLTLGLALRGDAEAKSDGVTFQVLVNGDVLLDRHWGKAAWDRHELDLAAYRGQDIQLELRTSPGPARDVEFDWALWGNPVIRVRSEPRRQAVEIASPTPLATMLDQDGAVPLQTLPVPTGYAYRCEPLLPGPVFACRQAIAPVAAPLDLAQHPFAVTILDANGAPSAGAPAFVGFRPATGACGGEEKAGFSAHPPASGKTIADFVLHLPEGQPRLRFAVGIRDGSKSGGCHFSIQVSGQSVWQHLVPGPGAWQEADVDLTPYAGRAVVLSLVVDPAGAYNYDWAFWAAPRIVQP